MLARAAHGARTGGGAAGGRRRGVCLRLVCSAVVGCVPGHADLLAFAQITWAITYQWDSFTGGSNGLTGVRPAAWLADKRMYYWLTLALVGAGVVAAPRALLAVWRALRAGRDSVLRADAIGIDVKRMQWAAFVVVGTAAGLSGALYAFSKGSISAGVVLAVGKSVDGLVMVLLGGIQTLAEYRRRYG